MVMKSNISFPPRVIGLNRRAFGTRMITLGLLAPLAQWDAIGGGANSQFSLQLPPAGAEFWENPHAYIGCLGDDGVVRLRVADGLIDPESAATGCVGPDGKVHHGLGFVEIDCGGQAYLLRVVDQRKASVALASGSVSRTDTGLKISRSSNGGQSIQIRLDRVAQGDLYVLETTDSLSHPVWKPVAETVGTEGPLQFDLSAGQNPQGFYRLRTQPSLGL
jgi:hypothetical protein